MSASARRRELSPRSGKLRMDRQPVVARITDPSLPAGKRKEIDNVMKKARASSNDYWDKKLLEVEEKDPNRWRHTGYKKMYIEGDSSSESERGDRDGFRYNNRYRSRSRSHSRPRTNRRTPPSSPPLRRRVSPPDMRRMSPDMRRPRSPDGRRPPRSPEIRRRPRSPPEPPMGVAGRRVNSVEGRKSPRSPRSPMDARRRSPSSPGSRRRSPLGVQQGKRGLILPRSKRPPSPPPKPSRSRSNSSVSSCSDESCSVCSPKHRRPRSRSNSLPRSRHGPRSPPPKMPGGHSRSSIPRPPPPTSSSLSNKSRVQIGSSGTSNSTSSRLRPVSPSLLRTEKYRDEKVSTGERNRALIERPLAPPEPVVKVTRSSRHSSPPEDPRLKIRPPEPPEPAPAPKKKKDKTSEKIRTKIKIEGEKRKKHGSSSDSEESSDSEGSLPTFTATTRLTLSERFGKMAQWSIDRSNMENMRITKDSAGGALKVMIEEGLESPPRRYSYSPAPAGHFPEELATTAPSGMLSWDDVRVRYEYYKSRGYLRDLDLKDYIKWEEWWYRYQEWLKQERYYEFWERQQIHRRRRKKVPISQRLN